MRAKHHPVIVSFLMLSVFFLCVSGGPVKAKIYKWKDDQGATHYTDNENNIPLKYRTKEKIQKLRGLAQPRQPGGAPAEESSAEEAEEGGEEATGPEAEMAGEGEGGSSEADSETLAFLKEVKDFLDLEITQHKKLLQSVPPDVKNGKYYILPIKNRAGKKFEMASKIKKSGVKALKPVSQYLLISAELDSKEQVGGDNYLGRILELKSRLEQEVVKKEKLLDMVVDEIAQTG